MKKIDKTLCELNKKDFEKLSKEIRKIVMEPKYMCRKCYRASSEKDFLCKPIKI